jgi:polysaccharide pyruvyl transferase WcaK-like protein
VATRYHNVIFSLLCDKPVIAISFHHKCDSLMAAMGLSTYCLDINNLRKEMLINKFLELEKNASILQEVTRERVKECSAALERQYKIIFNELTIEYQL